MRKGEGNKLTNLWLLLFHCVEPGGDAFSSYPCRFQSHLSSNLQKNVKNL